MADSASPAGLEGDGWRLELPDGLIAKEATAWGYESGMIARGWLGEAPVTVIVQSKTLDTGFNEWVRSALQPWVEHDERRIQVPGGPEDGIADQVEPIVASFALR